MLISCLAAGWEEASPRGGGKSESSCSMLLAQLWEPGVGRGVASLNWMDSSGTRPLAKRLLVPRSLQGRVLQICHHSLFWAHLGVKTTVGQVKHRFHWPGMSADVKSHIRNCATCGVNKGPFRRYRAFLADFRFGAPMDRVAVDVMGPIPISAQGNRYILVLADYFTRWVEAFPSPIRGLRLWLKNWCLTLSAVSVRHWNFTPTRAETLKVPSSRKSADFLRSKRLEQPLTIRVRMA